MRLEKFEQILRLKSGVILLKKNLNPDLKFDIFVSGDITPKGYEKKRSRLLTPYLPKQNSSKYITSAGPE